ncbi:hypothetical protein VNO77_33505 [Canavalia gladiata]|uniref:Uncharacterized protein n=1 Tax=Canavalia gladiata TaxID=3824 RepID=A0AAN9Q0T5_CANGL
MALVNATTGMKTPSDSGGFMEKFTLKFSAPSGDLLKSLTFAVKDMFDIEGHVASFGNPTWRRNHMAAISTAPTIVSLLGQGAICLGTTITDEMAARYEFKNNHGAWISTVKPEFGPGIAELIAEIQKTTGEHVPLCYSIFKEFRDALTNLLGVISLSLTPKCIHFN